MNPLHTLTLATLSPHPMRGEGRVRGVVRTVDFLAFE